MTVTSNQTLPPPEGPEYTPCACSHIEPEHQSDAGACLVCGCGAYRPVPGVVPSDEDVLVAIEEALEKQLLPTPGFAVLEHTRDAVVGALVPLVARLRAASVVVPAADRAAVLREVAAECDKAGGAYGQRGAINAAGAAFALMETFLRKADEAEYVAAPCSVGGCEPGGEPCSTHERLMAHAEGDHELCAPDCGAVVDRVAAETPPAETHVELQVWPLQRVLTEVRCGSQDWPWEEEWADLDRRHAETGYLARLEQEIRQNGITMPVLVGSDGRLWDGHHRLCIAVRLGIGYVPVEVVGPAVEAQPGKDTETP